MLMRRETKDDYSRRNISKKIHKLARKELRLWKAMWGEYLLQKFENTKYLQKINSAPRQASACQIESEDFASFLRNIFASSSPLIPSNLDKDQIQRIPPFQMKEFDIALQGMANLEGTDKHEIFIEMIKFTTQVRSMKV